MAIKEGKPLDSYLGQIIEGVPFGEDDLAPLQEYVGYVEKLAAPPEALVFTEPKLSADAVWQGLYGHADAVVLNPPDLHVIDLKYGEGVFVDHINNPQLLIYGLGALLNYDPQATIERVHMTIVQPRFTGAEPVRSLVWPISRLWRWVYRELMPALRATEDPEAKYRPGDWCRFCPARPTCKALAQFSTVTVQDDFTRVPLLSAEDLSVILKRAEVVLGWVEAVREEALARAQRGETIPGYVLGTGRSTREWASEPEQIAKALGLDQNDFYDMKLRSPAQIEKRLPKARHPDLEPFYVNKPGGVKLVRDDGRTPVPSRVAQDFLPSFLS